MNYRPHPHGTNNSNNDSRQCRGDRSVAPTENAHTSKFKPYPKYKDSGVEWLGEVPEGWEVRRLKNVCRFAYGDSLSAETRVDGDYKVFGSNGIVGTHEEPNTKAPCIVVGRKGSFGKLTYSDEPAFAIDTTYFIDKSQTTASHRCLYYALQILGLDTFSKDSAVPGLAREDAYCRVIPFCNDEEQRAIAAFLDRKTSEIDALIKKKQKLIELLQEKRTAIISHAVTKGLNPKARMKDSGVEWLGEVPEHWDIAPVYSRYEVVLGKMLDAKKITGEHLSPYLRNIDVQWDRVNVEDLPEMDFAPEDRIRLSLREGDLLVCEGGDIGRTAMWRGELAECYYQKAIHRVRPTRKTEFPRFFFYIMWTLSKLGLLKSGSNQNTIDHLTSVQLRHYRFPFPALDEQKAIADYLDSACCRLDAVLNKAEEAVAKLQEYRTALISAAVTGKIDVRQVV